MFIVIILFILLYFFYVYVDVNRYSAKSNVSFNKVVQKMHHKKMDITPTIAPTIDNLSQRKIVQKSLDLIFHEDFTDFYEKIKYSLWNTFVFPDFTRYNILVEASDGILSQHSDYIEIKTNGFISSRPYSYSNIAYLLYRHINLNGDSSGVTLEFTLKQSTENVQDVKLTRFRTFYNLTMSDPDDDYRLISSGISLMINNNTSQINILLCKNKIYLMQKSHFVAIYKLLDRSSENEKITFILNVSLNGTIDVFVKGFDSPNKEFIIGPIHLLTINNIGIQPNNPNQIVKSGKSLKTKIRNIDIGFGNFNYFTLMDFNDLTVPSTCLLGLERIKRPVINSSGEPANSIVKLNSSREDVSKIINYGQSAVLKIYEMKVSQF